ncbi:MAG: hypothetical protein JWN53_1015 [Gemmatimonadetes bacterium]|nr:hypothetical protein [Gemmatimonadota bacterium]
MHDDALQRDLGEHEVALQGSLSQGITGTPDAVETRIRCLVAHRLETLGSTDAGWTWLFRDPRDGRLWELTFPSGSLHAPGPRRLAVVQRETAEEKYGRTD